MGKEQLNVRVEEEVIEMVRQLSEQSGKVFGTHLSQAQIVEMAVREMAAHQRGESGK